LNLSFGNSGFKKYSEKIEEATLEKLAKLIHITAMLQQTKAYLFWRKIESS